VRALTFLLAVVAGLALACDGQHAAAPTPSPSASASPSPAASPSPSAAPSPTPRAGPSLAVLVNPLPSGQYVITLIGNDGRVPATARANQRTQISGPAAVATPMPEVATSLARVYYLDGDADLHYLAADGSTGLAARLAGSTQVHAGFAVSPDDRRLAVSLIDYSHSPATVQLYVGDLDGGNRSALFTSSTEYLWPVGWHDGNLVVAAGPAYVQNAAANPYNAFNGYLLLDPANGSLVTTIKPGCTLTGPLSAAGSACSSQSVSAVTWQGAAEIYGPAPTGLALGALSPDGLRIAVCCDETGRVFILVKPAVAGNVQASPTPLHDRQVGWVDDTHLVQGGGPQQQVVIYDTGSGAIIPVAAEGQVVARLPGGF